jgi:antitoxin component of RelBE/YafQ-DinJ toxin-antitoxin module
MHREIVKFRTSEEGKRLADAIARRMDLSTSSAMRVLVREKAEQLGVTPITQPDRRADQLEKQAA